MGILNGNRKRVPATILARLSSSGTSRATFVSSMSVPVDHIIRHDWIELACSLCMERRPCRALSKTDRAAPKVRAATSLMKSHDYVDICSCRALNTYPLFLCTAPSSQGADLISVARRKTAGEQRTSPRHGIRSLNGVAASKEPRRAVSRPAQRGKFLFFPSIAAGCLEE
ncbi:hypothetical protein EJ04DRAFT_516618 [Polyplosphaeria fusca]|uniref:Uncharacterized protein n=1 Tax=Polyplosphaeria fusca TaxID=682080 RepID=A0A9P4QLA3_9PLEO|nr:hypothetical protein EJ04DRAFT_516618 [Polyplosphaeria fusca]